MDWTATIDGYCERTGPEFWAEPVNALTNAAFFVAALIIWLRIGRARLPIARVLCVLLVAIGAGSFLFHSFATRWAALSDVLPIVLFVLVYIFAANRHYLCWPVWAAVLGTVFFGIAPLPPAVGWLAAQIPFLAISGPYWFLPPLIAGYGLILLPVHPATGRGLILGAAILTLSLTARSLDGMVCGQLPFGTHFLWHILNAVMLGWMIEVYRRHMVAARGGLG